MNNIEKLKTLFFNPALFFAQVSKEKDYWPSIKLFAIIYMISNASLLIPLALIIPFIPGIVMSIGILISFLIIFVLGIILLIYAFLTPWIYAFFTYLGVLIFGGKDKYFFPTFKASTYGLCILMIYGLLANILLVFFGIIFLLMIVGTGINEASEVVGMFGIISLMLLFLLLLLIAFIHRVYATMVGLALYNNMSYGKSFLAVIFIPALIFIVYILFVITAAFSGGF